MFSDFIEIGRCEELIVMMITMRIITNTYLFSRGTFLRGYLKHDIKNFQHLVCQPRRIANPNHTTTVFQVFSKVGLAVFGLIMGFPREMRRWKPNVLD